MLEMHGNSSEHALQVTVFPGLRYNYRSGQWAGRHGQGGFSGYRRWAGSCGQRGLVIIGDGQAVVGRGV